MRLPSIEQQQYIENLIYTKLDSSVSYPHVLRWLNNFDDEDQDKAITVLSHLQYYSYDRILMILKEHISNIKDSCNTNCIYVPIGEVGKSGYSVLYSCQQILKKRGMYANCIQDAVQMATTNKDVVVLVDDIIGSAKTLCDWLKKQEEDPNIGHGIKQLLKEKRMIILSIVILEKGKNKINREYPTIATYGEISRKSFLHSGSVFGGSVSMKIYRDFCYKYGMRLAPQNPLGYDNCQALIVFNHSTPNNSLPIIWYNKTIDKHPWYPLYPRFASQRIETEKESKKDLRKQLVIYHELFGYNNIDKRLFEKVNLLLFQMLKLLLENKDDLTMMVIMGISQNEIEELWQKGIEKGMWDINHKITDLCKTQYNKIKKRVLFTKTKIKANFAKTEVIMPNEIIYIPETFKGEK